jgi:hypothetical protein
MKDYKIYKRRDGQGFEFFGSIYADGLKEAKKIFARRMTEDNWNQSNNIQWLDSEEDGVEETGWYDFSGGTPSYNEDTEKYNVEEARDFLLVSEKDIEKGFDCWREDVYTYELRKK